MGLTEDPARHKESVDNSAMRFRGANEMDGFGDQPFHHRQTNYSHHLFWPSLVRVAVECDGPARTIVLGKV
jgi:hypothetical protein